MKIGVMPGTSAKRAYAPVIPHADAQFWPLAAIAILLMLQLVMTQTRAINWDEYFYFHQVADFAVGRLDRPIQTIHTRLFAWLPGLFVISTDHIVLARIFMLGCEAATLGSIYLIARAFTDRQTSILAPLLYLSAGYVIQHGMSFRVDPLLTASLMAALALLTRDRLNLSGVLLFGLFAGFGGMVSIKAILYLPAFLGIAMWRWADTGYKRDTAIRLAFCAITAISTFALLYLWHRTGVSVSGGAEEALKSDISSASSWAFFLGIPGYWRFIVKGIFVAPVFAAMIMATPFLMAKFHADKSVYFALAGLWLPITTLGFYVNTAPYFYVFILAPLAIAVLPAIAWAKRRYGARLLAIALLLCGTGIWLTEQYGVIDRQRQLEYDVHTIFPEPVYYIDQNYMLGDWPKANNFMTMWGLSKYREVGEASYTRMIEERTVPLLLVNDDILESIILGDSSVLLPEDNFTLMETYISITPFIWMAGEDFAAETGEHSVKIRVPGPYTVHGGDLIVDGTSFSDGDVVFLERGEHLFSAPSNTASRLIWGNRLQMPDQPLEEGPIYVSF